MKVPHSIKIKGARTHNLKNIDITIPHKKLVVITGVSGSGKSTLAFDVIYAEAQRRYLETLSTYARQFIHAFERPDADLIEGLSPSISIEQKTIHKNQRSTVGTITEIYGFIRLLFSRIGSSNEDGYKNSHHILKKEDDIIEQIMSFEEGTEILVFSPLVIGRKGHYRELFADILKKGFLKARIDGTLQDIENGTILDRYKIHDIDILIDHFLISSKTKTRLINSLNTAFKYSWNKSSCICENVSTKKEAYHFVKYTTLTETKKATQYAPNLFSFNSKYGACSTCKGIGHINTATEDLVVTDPSLSTAKGALASIGPQNQPYIWKQIVSVYKQLNLSLSVPFSKIPKKEKKIILYGTEKETTYVTIVHNSEKFQLPISFIGIYNYIKKESESSSQRRQKWASEFMKMEICPKCKGARLNEKSLAVKIGNDNIFDIVSLSVKEASQYFNTLPSQLQTTKKKIALPIITEINKRLDFLVNVGLSYMTLSRSAATLSGGEAQRIRLSAQIGSRLSNVLYILDEPSIGLHQRDNDKLISSLESLRDAGNTILVVEHDKEIMQRSDWIVDLGPGAGEHGGKVVAQGNPKSLPPSISTTIAYLKGKKFLDIPKNRRKGNGKALTLYKCNGHNLKSVDLTIPLGNLVVITGVSGSGKSSLINKTLYPVLSQKLLKSRIKELPYQSISSLEFIDKVIEIDQTPIGRTPRSNPATYTGLFSLIRSLYSSLPESSIRGYKEGRFSFNVKDGRCHSCEGKGVNKIEMGFLPDVYVTCDICKGKRYNRETLLITYKGKNIADVLDMTIEDAITFFDSIPKVKRILATMESIGLGYLRLGQSSTTLSGGEAQRIKLSTELSKIQTGNTIYILDEPTTGLHFQDIKLLMKSLHQFVNQGNTVIVIEHNLDVIAQADWIIDLGPEGGDQGGEIVAQGIPEDVATNPTSITGRYLKKELAHYRSVMSQEITISRKIEEALKESVIQKNKTRTNVLRSIQKTLIEKEKEVRKEGKGMLSEELEISVLTKLAKQRRDSILQFQKDKRLDLVANEKDNLKVIEEYLPSQLSEEEIKFTIKNILSEIDTYKEKSFGEIMGLVLQKLNGKADGEHIQKILQEECKKFDIA